MSERGSHISPNEWDIAAEKQDAQHGDTGDFIRQVFYDPAISNLIGNVSGKDILDAGCGNGYWVRRLAEEARSVLGVDSSSELLKRAAYYNNPQNVKYAAMDLTRELAIPDQSIDIVLSNIVLDYLPDLSTFAEESQRVLRSGGRLVFGVIHPFFNVSQMREGSTMYSEQLGYFDQGEVKKKTYRGGLEVTMQNRTVSDYINPFITSGLTLTQLEEPSYPESLLITEPKFCAEKSLPRFLMLSFEK